MKIRKINILLAATFGILISLVGCTKDDGPIPSRVSVDAIPAVSTNIDASGSASISIANLAAFSGKFTISMYFAGATPPSKVDMVVRKNGVASSVKLYKGAISTFPTTFTVTAAEISALFGTAIVLNDTYDFAPDLYVGDKKYEAFPLTGNGSGAGVIAMPLFGEYTRFKALP